MSFSLFVCLFHLLIGGCQAGERPALTGPSVYFKGADGSVSDLQAAAVGQSSHPCTSTSDLLPVYLSSSFFQWYVLFTA